jgi:hypothetical protein
MTTRAQRRARARAVAKGDLISQFVRANQGGTDLDGKDDRRIAMERTMAEAQREAAAEEAAQKERELVPIRQHEAKLNAERQEANRRARAALCLERDYPYFLEICPPFSRYAGKEEDYLDSVRNAFLDFKERLASQGVEITQAGLETLAEVSEDNTGLNWSDAVTFERVWGHLVEIDYVKEGRDYTVERAPAPAANEPQEPQESFDTLLRKHSTDDPALKRAAHDFAIEEARPTFNAWVDSLLSFGYSMPLETAKRVSEWFTRNNRSFLDRASYDDCRRCFVREGIMPRNCLTPDDLAAEEMSGLDLNTVEGRRRAAQLHPEGMRRAESALNQFQSQVL